MDGARVAIIEDDEVFRNMTKRNLEATGHQVVAEASTRQEALSLVEQMAAGEVEADVILLDGNLTETDTYEDARVIAEQLKNAGVTSVVLGFSLGSLLEHDIEVSADVGKRWGRVAAAIEAI